MYVNQSKNATAGLDSGTYTYQAFATDTSSNSNSTEQRTITIKSDATDPQINFTTPTPPNGTTQSETNVEVNVSIIEANLEDVIYNWNGTNFTYYNDSLVLMLNFDNVSALGENDTHVVDVSGNGNNGTAESGASYSTSGKYGGAFEFDGVNGYINNSVINLTGTEVTISAWVNAKKFQSSSPFISSLAGIEEVTIEGTQTALIRFGDSDLDMNLTQFVLANSSGTQRKLNGTTPLNTSTWYHVAGTYNGEVMSLYLNGVLDSSNSSLLTGEFPGRGNFHIAMSGDSRYLNGSIDEVRIWDRTLSADEVYQQYVSNLNKFNQTQWYLYVNQSKNATAGLDDGNYTYQAFATDTVGNGNATEERTVTIGTETFPCTCGDICVNMTGWWRDNGTFNASGTVIQAAVNNATQGETICVKNGTYRETVNVNKSDLTIRVENGSSVTTVSGSLNPNDHIFNITDQTNVTLDGFVIRDARGTGQSVAGIYMKNASECNISGNVVTNLSATGSHDVYGIWLYEDSSNNTFSTSVYNISANNDAYGIRLYSSSNNNTFSTSTRVYNISAATDDAYGISLYSSSNNTFSTSISVYNIS
ncbi:Concanavalin A-like lectin, partial [Candidatus Methanophagaceae archaeon]